MHGLVYRLGLQDIYLFERVLVWTYSYYDSTEIKSVYRLGLDNVYLFEGIGCLRQYIDQTWFTVLVYRISNCLNVGYTYDNVDITPGLPSCFRQYLPVWT